jgi:hypothetical protein
MRNAARAGGLLPGIALWVIGGALWLAGGRYAFPLGSTAFRWFPILALLALFSVSVISTSTYAALPPVRAVLSLILTISVLPAAALGALVELLATGDPMGVVSGGICGALLALLIQFAGKVGAVFLEGRAAQAARRKPNPLRASWWGMAVSVCAAGTASYFIARYAGALAGTVPFSGISAFVVVGLAITRYARNIRQATLAIRNARRGQRPPPPAG